MNKNPVDLPLLRGRTTKNLLSSAKHNVKQSQRKLSRKYDVSQSTVGRILKRNNVQVQNRKEAPKYTAKTIALS